MKTYIQIDCSKELPKEVDKEYYTISNGSISFKDVKMFHKIEGFVSSLGIETTHWLKEIDLEELMVKFHNHIIIGVSNNEIKLRVQQFLNDNNI